MLNQERRRLVRRFHALGILVLTLLTLSAPPAGREARADEACCNTCDPPLWACQQNCVDNFPVGPGSWMQMCQNACDAQFNSCISNCGSCE
jgi:hypothetical protein